MARIERAYTRGSKRLAAFVLRVGDGWSQRRRFCTRSSSCPGPERIGWSCGRGTTTEEPEPTRDPRSCRHRRRLRDGQLCRFLDLPGRCCLGRCL